MATWMGDLFAGVSSWRPMVANLPSFAQAIGASFTDLAPRSSQLVAPRVPEQHFREDGSLELPIFVLF